MGPESKPAFHHTRTNVWDKRETQIQEAVEIMAASPSPRPSAVARAGEYELPVERITGGLEALQREKTGS